MKNVQETALEQKLKAFVALSDSELETLRYMLRRRRQFLAGHDIVHQGQADQAAFVLVSGWAASYKVLHDGSRQIVDFQIPGDFLGLRSLLLHTSDHTIEPVVDIEVAEVLHDDLMLAFSQSPRLATAILWSASRDEAMVVEHLVGLGRRDSLVRMVHFFLELDARLKLIRMGGDDGFDCPLTQYLLADALGLSAVHVNRVLRQLREDGLLTFRGGRVVLEDYDRLMEISGFDPMYLDQTGPLLP